MLSCSGRSQTQVSTDVGRGKGQQGGMEAQAGQWEQEHSIEGRFGFFRAWHQRQLRDPILSSMECSYPCCLIQVSWAAQHILPATAGSKLQQYVLGSPGDLCHVVGRGELCTMKDRASWNPILPSMEPGHPDWLSGTF